MKTAIRITEGEYNYSSPTYRHFYMQILGKQTYSQSYSVIGTIKWQSDKETEEKVASGEREGNWYALSYEVSTSIPEDLLAMAKLAKFIKDNCYMHSAQPSEIISLIGGVDHFYNNCDFIPKAWIGTMRRFKIMKGGEYYSNMYVANSIVAEKRLAKFAETKTGVFTLEDDGILKA